MNLIDTDAPFLKNDPSSGAVLNTDNAGYEAHKRMRKAKLLEKQSTNNRLLMLENGLEEIKQLLLRQLEQQK